MQTDYAGHEAIYRELKAQPDRPGWDDAQELQRGIRILEGVLRWPVFPSGGRLLELGCGAGNIGLYLARRGWTVCGVDIAPTAVEWARENAARQGVDASFEVADVLRLDGFADAAFDVVLDGHCLHCIIGADRDLFFASALRVLRAGGYLCVRTMCNEMSPEAAARQGYDAQSRCAIREGMATRYFGRANDILQEIIRGGFDVVQMVVMGPERSEDADEMVLLARKPG